MKPITIFALILLTAPSFAATPAEKAIQQATAAIEKQPAYYPYYNALAMAFARRARETSNTGFYVKAEETLKKSFALNRDNFEGLKIEAWLELGRHEFAKAKETAARLNRRSPDDIAIYGYLTDANIELGNYPDAVAAAQWMLDLKPGNVAGLMRAGYLRELHGNLEGALELMQMAYDSTPFSETEDRAWLLTQMSHLELVAGDPGKAGEFADNALTVFPDYHYALGVLAQIRTAQARFEDTVKLLLRRYEVAPHAENLYALAEAQQLAGDQDGARASFDEFEKRSRSESALADNSNHELIYYYVDHAGQPTKALSIARSEIERRQDVYTRDAYAWALAANGDYAEANVQIRKALAVGVKDPKLLRHARAIESHLQADR